MSDSTPMVGNGIYAHHEPLCAVGAACRWCDRERARQAPERVALRADQESRIGRPRRYRKRRQS